MSAIGYTVGDSTVMLRRNLRRLRRYPSMTLMLIGMPIIFLLLFVYVFGGQLGAASGGRGAYLDYLAPGILLMTIASAVQGTSITVAMDMTTGIVDRFRTMAIARASVLCGHVLSSLTQALVSIVVVLGVAIGLGYSPHAGVGHWLAAFGILALFAVALVWLAVALGLAADSVETASNTPMFLTLLPFLGSGFVPPATMPAGLRQFAEYQPFTPVTDTVRGLLGGGGASSAHVLLAIAWSVAIAALSSLWARRLYERSRRS